MTLDGEVGRVEDAAFGGPQPRLVAALLLLERHRCWSPEELAEQIWPQRLPARWRPALRGLVSRVRGLLFAVGAETDCVAHRSGRYHVHLPGLSVDLEQARDWLREASVTADTAGYAVTEPLAESARSVLCQEVLPGVEVPWVQELRDRADDEYVEALLLLGRARRGLERWAPAREALLEVVRRDPYGEDGWRELIALEREAGNDAAAVLAYGACRERLVGDLGVEPAPRTRALLGGIPALAAR